MESLDNEILGLIFLNLSFNDLMIITMVCKRFRKIFKNPWCCLMNDNFKLVQILIDTRGTKLTKSKRLCRYDCPELLEKWLCSWYNSEINKIKKNKQKLYEKVHNFNNLYYHLFHISIKHNCFQNINCLEIITHPNTIWMGFDIKDYIMLNGRHDEFIQYAVVNNKINILQNDIKKCIKSGTIKLLKFMLKNYFSEPFNYSTLWSLLCYTLYVRNTQAYREIIYNYPGLLDDTRRFTILLSWAVYGVNTPWIIYFEHKYKDVIKWYGGMIGAIRANNLKWFMYFYNKALESGQGYNKGELLRYARDYKMVRMYSLVESLPKIKVHLKNTK